MTGDLIRLSARAVRDLLKDRQVTPLELLEALETRIAEVNGPVNALPTLCFERARARAIEQDFSTLPLAGIPIVIKDLLTVSGVRTTFGSMAYRDHVPEASDLLVERIEAAGALFMPNPIRPSSGLGPIRLMMSLDLPVTPGTPRSQRQDRPEAQPWRWRPEWRGLQPDLILAARCVTPPVSARSWVFARARGASRRILARLPSTG